MWTVIYVKRLSGNWRMYQNAAIITPFEQANKFTTYFGLKIVLAPMSYPPLMLNIIAGFSGLGQNVTIMSQINGNNMSELNIR